MNHPSSPRRRTRDVAPISDLFHSSGARYTALCALIAFAFLLGGGARADILSLALLRPLAIFLGGYALFFAKRDRLAKLGVPFWLVLGMAMLAAIQLLPLPPGLWTALPGRQLVAEISADLGMQHLWRPLTLSPGRTTNTLFALTIPLAAFLLVSIQQRGGRNRLIWPILIAGAASALLGLLQIIGPTQGPLYLYRITNTGTAVGLFANRNHNALFLASLLPLLGYAALFSRKVGPRGGFLLAACAGGALFIFPLILVNGSRAGAAAALASGVTTAALMWLYHRSQREQVRKARVAQWAGLLIVGMVVLISAATWAASRSLVTDRLLDESLAEETRVQVLPHLIEMAEAYFPIGSGFGTFDLVYKVIEPRSLLRPQYLNQAHNDLLQPIIEGGLPAMLLLLAGLFWFGRSVWRCWRAFAHAANQSRDEPDPGIFASVSLAALLAGSLVDYPLRTPSLMVIAVMLCCIIQQSVWSVSERQRK